MLHQYTWWLYHVTTAELQAEEHDDPEPRHRVLRDVEAAMVGARPSLELAALYAIHGRVLAHMDSLPVAAMDYERALDILDRYTGSGARHLAIACLDSLAFIRIVQGQLNPMHPEDYESAAALLDRADALIRGSSKNALPHAARDWLEVRITRAQLAQRLRNLAVAYGELAQAWHACHHLRPRESAQAARAAIAAEMRETDRVGARFGLPGRDDMPENVQTVLAIALDEFDWRLPSHDEAAAKVFFHRLENQLAYVGPGSSEWEWPQRTPRTREEV